MVLNNMGMLRNIAKHFLQLKAIYAMNRMLVLLIILFVNVATQKKFQPIESTLVAEKAHSTWCIERAPN